MTEAHQDAESPKNNRDRFLLAAVDAARGRCFVHHDFAKTRKLRFQFLPEPFSHFFNRRVLQALDVIEIGVIQQFHQRFHCVADSGVIVNPSGLWIDIALH
jgi:hypothetical protein